MTAEILAELIGATGPTMTGWKRGSQPKKKKLEALEKLFREAGLEQYTARYLDWGPARKEGTVSIRPHPKSTKPLPELEALKAHRRNRGA